jgi:hypothetical protein
MNKNIEIIDKYEDNIYKTIKEISFKNKFVNCNFFVHLYAISDIP